VAPPPRLALYIKDSLEDAMGWLLAGGLLVG
jgi:hypothetical protein